MVIVCPAVKPRPLATGIRVAPVVVAVLTVVAPAVPTVAITADSMFAPLSIRIVWPAEKSATLATCWHSPHTFRSTTAGCISGWVQRPRPALIFHGRTGARNMLRTLPPFNWWWSAKVLASFAGRALAVRSSVTHQLTLATIWPLRWPDTVVASIRPKPAVGTP